MQVYASGPQVPAHEFVAHACVPSAHHTGKIHSVVASPTQIALRSSRHCRNALHDAGWAATHAWAAVQGYWLLRSQLAMHVDNESLGAALPFGKGPPLSSVLRQPASQAQLSITFWTGFTAT